MRYCRLQEVKKKMTPWKYMYTKIFLIGNCYVWEGGGSTVKKYKIITPFVLISQRLTYVQKFP